jgi:hypothetical protein
MNIYLLLKYYLNLNSKNLNIKSAAIRVDLRRSFIKEDLNTRLDKLIKTDLDFQDDYAYRVNIEKLSNKLWCAQIRAKSENTVSSKLHLVYRFQNKSVHLTLIK